MCGKWHFGCGQAGAGVVALIVFGAQGDNGTGASHLKSTERVRRVGIVANERE